MFARPPSNKERSSVCCGVSSWGLLRSEDFCFLPPSRGLTNMKKVVGNRVDATTTLITSMVDFVAVMAT